MRKAIEVLENQKENFEKLVKSSKDVTKFESRIKELKNSLEEKSKDVMKLENEN